MHLVTALMEDRSFTLLAQQVLLHLSLAEMLECRRVSRSWRALANTLLRSSTRTRDRWRHPQMARKAAAAIGSLGDSGVTTHKIHLHPLYVKLSGRGYRLIKCFPHGRVLLIMFLRARPQTPRPSEYRLCLVSWPDVSKVLYTTKFAGVCGNFLLGSRHFLVLWWYTRSLESADHINLHFEIIENESQMEATTKKNNTAASSTVHLNDFVSPVVELHRRYSPGDGPRLHHAIRKHFPGLNVHARVFRPASLDESADQFGRHEVFYFSTLRDETLRDLWVLDKGTGKVIIRRRTSRSDWICSAFVSRDPIEIDFQGYQHPVAVFYIRTSKTFAVWDLNRPGHPRHVGIDTTGLLKELWDCNQVYGSRSKWIFEISKPGQVCFLHVDRPASYMVKNAAGPCQCSLLVTSGLPHTSDLSRGEQQQTHECVLKDSMLDVKASSISRGQENTRTHVYFVGDRFTIVGRGADSLLEVDINDCWMPRDLRAPNESWWRILVSVLVGLVVAVMSEFYKCEQS